MNILLSNHNCLDHNTRPRSACRAWWNLPGFHLLAAAFLLLIMFMFLRAEPSQQAQPISPADIPGLRLMAGGVNTGSRFSVTITEIERKSP